MNPLVTLAQLGKLYKQQESQIAFIEQCERMGICTSGEALDAIIELDKEVKAQTKGIDPVQFMKDQLGSASNIN